MTVLDCDQQTVLWLRRALGEYAKTRPVLRPSPHEVGRGAGGEGPAAIPADADAATLRRVVEALSLEGFLYRAAPAVILSEAKDLPEGTSRSRQEILRRSAPQDDRSDLLAAVALPRWREKATQTLLANLRAPRQRRTAMSRSPRCF